MAPTKSLKSINPVQLAAQNEQIQGQLPLVDCERLVPLLRENTGSIDFSLQFMQDESQRAIVQLSLAVVLMLECRRCLQPFSQQFKVDVNLAVIGNVEAAEGLPECYEPLLVTDGVVALESLIEDELLLNLPVMPGHSDKECRVALPENWMSNELEERKNPFGVLKKLLRSD